MNLVAVVGRSGAGKTTLLRAVIAELARRGRTVGVIKHCGHGFDLGGPDKDSSLLLGAGAEAVVLAGPKGWAVVGAARRRPADRSLAARLPAVDIALVEAGRGEPGIPRFEVRRRGTGGSRKPRDRGLLAIIAEAPGWRGRPGQGGPTVKEIAGMIEKSVRRTDGGTRLTVDGKDVPLNPFVRSFIERTVKGMIGALDGVPRRPRTIGITIRGGQGR